MAMFKDGHEAVLWESPEECVRVCRELLVDEERRKSIVTAGMQRVRQMKVGNEDVCQAILNEIAT
jgi:spore maturation protein CgeB